jgi:transcriptional regulator with XRE-family HTH domain
VKGEKMKIYQKISNYLSENGIKQKYISERTGIPENTLSMILNGKRKMDADEFVEIVISLGTDANKFINKEKTEESTETEE